jgi:hypothetical protein
MSSLGSGQKATDTQAESGTHDQPDPGQAMPDRNDRIREIAYFLWLDEGRPDGEEGRIGPPPNPSLSQNTSNASGSKASLLANRWSIPASRRALDAQRRNSRSFGAAGPFRKEFGWFRQGYPSVPPQPLRRRAPRRGKLAITELN